MKEEKSLVIPKSTLSRLPIYYCYLQERMAEGQEFVSSSAMAESLSLGAVQVRKDLAGVSSVPGRSKVGFRTEQLLNDLKSYLGYDDYNEAVLVGVGGLGKTLLQYPGFKNYGLDVVAGFDVDPNVVGRTIGGKPVYAISQLEGLVRRLGVSTGRCRYACGQRNQRNMEFCTGTYHAPCGGDYQEREPCGESGSLVGQARGGELSDWLLLY